MDISSMLKSSTKGLLSTVAIIMLLGVAFRCEEVGDLIPENNAPTVAQAPDNVSLDEGFGTSTVSLSGAFSDEDGDQLTLSATSDDTNVVTVSVSGTTLTITEAGTGSSTVTVTASDGNGGEVSASFTVSVNEASNTQPTVVQAIEDQSLDAGFGSATVSLDGVFQDEETQQLTYTAESSATSVVTVSVSDSELTITEVGEGTATITVTATDGDGGMVSDDFEVAVQGPDNTDPEVITPIPDMTLAQGFGTEMLKLPDYFSDAETQMLAFSATSSEESVVTVSVEGGDLTITEVGIGTSTVTVTAYDEAQASVSDDFIVTVETATCSNDNSTDQNNTGCQYTPTVSNQYDELVADGMRTITTNRVPNHDYGNQLENMGISGLTSTEVTMSFTASPSLANQSTGILTAENRPAYSFGVALNGVPIDPAPAEPFIFEDETTGEFNWDWVYEPNNNMEAVGLDCNIAHLQPDQAAGTGLIHYHGDMMVFAESLYQGISSGTAPNEPVQIGWAADGFPIVYKYGPTASGQGVELLTSSYQLKSGSRPGDGTTAPCGEYNGKYTNDYEYVESAGDLDECNGIQRSITLTTPAGQTETFSYFYVITDEFPVISRCISGTPADYFAKGQGG